MNVKIVRRSGKLCLSIGDRIFPAMAFKSFRPNPANISEFYAAGVRLFEVLSSGVICALGVPYSRFGESWVGEGEYDFAPFDRQMDMFLENAPGGYFAPMFQIDTRPWYLANHPDAPNSFTHLSQIAGDGHFRRQAADYLKAMITHCEEKYGGHVYGYFMLGGTTTEWFSDRDYEESHPIKEAAYRRFTGDKTAVLPSKERLERDGEVFLGGDEDDIRTARRFHASLISDLILFFAAEAQSILRHKKLLGLYFGYLFELGAPRLFNAGHLDYERVFFSDDLDMFSAPSSYSFRMQTDPSAFMVTQKTLDMHEKLYFHEFDHRTHTIPVMLEEPAENSDNRIIRGIPGAENRCANESESLNLMYRDFLLCKANGAAFRWFDMFDGWFRSEGMMGAIAGMLSLDQILLGYDSASAAEIAVFAGGEAMYGVRKSSPLTNLALNAFRRTLAEIGAPYDVYTFSDLALPVCENYRLVIFLNAYDIPPVWQDRIKSRFERDKKTILWLYAPDYARDGVNSAENIAGITRISVEESRNTHGDFQYRGRTAANPLAPPFFRVDDRNAETLAVFADGTTACARKKLPAYTSVYCACPNPPSSLLRDIARESGCFIYSEDPLVYTYVCSAFVGVYNASDSDCSVSVRGDGTYTDLFTDIKVYAAGGKLMLPVRQLRAFMLMPVSD